MLIRIGIRYGSDESAEFLDKLYEFIASEVYQKWPFPLFDAELFLASGYMKAMT